MNDTTTTTTTTTEKVIDYFNLAGKDKVEFNPAIKIKMTPHSNIVWIDKMYKVRDTYMVAVSTATDATNMNINAVDQTWLNSLLIRLYSLYGTKKTKVDS